MKISRNMRLAFVISFCYWGYLYFTSNMDISMDAASYDYLGKFLNEQGWRAYFETGPNREPLYPFLVALSMKIADVFSISYQYIQKLFQMGVLFISQILALKILTHLKVGEKVTALTILYMGISPAIVNSAFSLYSEIVAIPFSLGMILISIKAYKVIEDGKISRIFKIGLLSALIYILALFAKGIFVLCMYVVLLAFFIYVVVNNRRATFKSLVYIITTLIVFQAALLSYQFLNKKYNGEFVYTNRVERIFYGNADKRARPLTKNIILSHLANIPGEKVCRKFFTPKQCDYCGLRAQDDIGGLELPKILYKLKIPPEEQTAKTYELAFAKIKERPGQYAFFMWVEGMKMFFWESTQIGFVNYPGWLNKTFKFVPFKNGVRLIVSLLSMIAFIHLAVCAFKKRGKDEQTLTMILLLVILLSYIISFTFVTTLTRYSLPIAPLFIICIALFFDRDRKKVSDET